MFVGTEGSGWSDRTKEPAQVNREAAENEPRSRRHAAVKAEQMIQQLAEDEELNF